jgi:hypothetical protein
MNLPSELHSELPKPRVHRAIRFVIAGIVVGIAILLLSQMVKPMDGDNTRSQTVNEITQLTIAAETFKLKYKTYPPSRIFLSNNLDDYRNDPESLAYLKSIWPRLTWNNIDWSGGAPGFKSTNLEGDQCLVYFLAGPARQGFSVTPTNPTQPGGNRAGPFFEFALHRLIMRIPGTPFSSFEDPFSKNVYAFFSSGMSNEYADDCPSLKVKPYFRRAGGIEFYNPTSVQIVSAGADGIFGPGGAWAPETAAQDAGPHGRDDLSNFHGDQLGR